VEGGGGAGEDLGMGTSVSNSEVVVTRSELLFVLFHVPPVGIVHTEEYKIIVYIQYICI
jgi:hypothetical protein